MPHLQSCNLEGSDDTHLWPWQAAFRSAVRAFASSLRRQVSRRGVEGSKLTVVCRCRDMPEVFVPERPSGQRLQAETQQPTNANGLHNEAAHSGGLPLNHSLLHAAATPGSNATIASGLSVIPSLFGIQISTPPFGVDREAEALSSEQAQQVFLSRLLLLLGCLVILCLLLF